MKPVIWHPGAEDDLEEIVDYIAIYNIKAALKLARRIVGAIEDNLLSSPYMGRPGRVEGTRELVVRQNYIVIYEVAADAVNVLNVIHDARIYP